MKARATGTAALIAAMAIATGTAQAATPTVTNFTAGMPANTNLAMDITAGPDGRAWFTTQFPSTLSAVDTSGNIANPSPISQVGQPFGIAPGSDGLLYYALTANAGSSQGTNFIGAANPASGAHTEAWFGGGDFSAPQYPTTAPDGLIRVTMSGNLGNSTQSSIGKIQLATGGSNPPSGQGLIATTPVGTASAVPQKITAGPSDTSASASPALWFTEFATGKIGRVTTASAGGGPEFDVVNEFALLPANGPEDIELGPDGNLWVTMFGQNKVARVTPPSTFNGTPTVTTFDLLPGGGNILGIAAGPDNNMWIADETGGRIIRMNLSGQITGNWAVDSPRFITTGADGNLWFTANGASGSRVARITTALDPPEHRNTTAIDIPTGGASAGGNPITVANEPGFITDVNVRVTGISHNFPDDLDLILQPPNGLPIMLASDVGSAVGTRVANAQKKSYPANGVTLSFDDASQFSLRDKMPLVSGIYKPTNIADPGGVNGSDSDGGGLAPSGSFDTFMGAQQGFGANGTWRLWVFDDMSNVVDKTNKVFGGWGLDIETEVQLNVNIGGGGSGTITSSPAGISCDGSDECIGLFPAATDVTLTATPNAGSRFTGFTGCDSGSGNTCTIDMDAQDVEERTVGAGFELTGSTATPPPPTPAATGQRAAALAKCKKIKRKKAKKKCIRKANLLPL